MNIVIENLNENIINSIGISNASVYKGVFDVTQIFGQISAMQYEKVIIDITALNNYSDINSIKSLLSFIPGDKIILVMNEQNVTPDYLKTIIESGLYNIAYNGEQIVSLYSSPNTYDDAMVLVNKTANQARVIGFKNVTKHAGSTTLIYILKKHLERNRKVLAIELDKLDFKFFYDKEMISIQENDLPLTLQNNSNQDIILIDLNLSKDALKYCDEIIYLIEPTMIRINQSMMVDPTMFRKLTGEKVLLNMSPLEKDDIKQFEFESHLKIFYNIPLINERKNSNIIDELISKLKL